MLSTQHSNNTDSVYEGAIYKILCIEDNTFEIRYGYYAEIEKKNPAVEPMPIYPDFIKNPKHTKEGFSFVTKMQDACGHYKGKFARFKECAECEFFKEGQDLIGICTCTKRKKNE
ncbi:MAG: hypothetical protein E7548_05980 [Ruminococcaceae bacterium]|nr:hypothetical protein [Oscillospiraceae bacterium]